MKKSTTKVYERICRRVIAKNCLTHTSSVNKVVTSVKDALDSSKSWGTNLPIHAAGKWYLRTFHNLPEEEILEVILHAAFYTGFPRAAVALNTAVDVFKEAGLIE